MRVCHISDWHGQTIDLSRYGKIDVCVVTGDMLPNFPLEAFRDDVTLKITLHDLASGKPQPRGAYVGRRIDKLRERAQQEQWCSMVPFRRNANIDEDVPVIAVRGNHDFIDLSAWIGGDVWEVNADASRTTTLYGMKFGGCRGINAIVGEWSDELLAYEFDEAMRHVPSDIDVLVTHAPPHLVLDSVPELRSHYGSQAISSWITRLCVSGYNLKAHMFGHVHESFGAQTWDGGSKILFSNAATGVKMLDI